MAAFAVSAYASSYYRAGSKPFNPVLGETYECVREDKGFQFFSEQVLQCCCSLISLDEHISADYLVGVFSTVCTECPVICPCMLTPRLGLIKTWTPHNYTIQ